MTNCRETLLVINTEKMRDGPHNQAEVDDNIIHNVDSAISFSRGENEFLDADDEIEFIDTDMLSDQKLASHIDDTVIWRYVNAISGDNADNFR